MAMGFFFLFYFRSLKIGSIFEKYSSPLSPSYTRVLRAYERDGRRVYLERERENKFYDFLAVSVTGR